MKNSVAFTGAKLGVFGVIALGALGLSGACGSSSDTVPEGCVADPASTAICVTEPQPGDSAHAYQGVKALVGFYPTDQCVAGEEVMKLSYDLAQTCFGWRREAEPDPRDNSATHFQCYSDRVCYTQSTKVLTCDGSLTNKEVRTDACTKDEAGDIWLKLLSGTESCPAPPAGFSCPLSEPGEGTPGKS
jgi:hypothetical protein